jgi:hypothetical protein
MLHNFVEGANAVTFNKTWPIIPIYCGANRNKCGTVNQCHHPSWGNEARDGTLCFKHNHAAGGYFTGSQVSYPVLYFYCATAALEKWRYIEDLLRDHRELPRAGSWAASRWVRHYFHGLIRQYLEQGLKASASNRQLDDREHLAPFSCS